MLKIRGMSIAETLYVGVNGFGTPLTSSLTIELRGRQTRSKATGLEAPLERFVRKHFSPF